MWKLGDGDRATALSVVLVASALLAGVPVDGAVAASDNEAPLADAGLDRNVTANVTVYLDATGSRDPDGDIDGYEWRLERPDGNYTTPRCGDCGRTSFVPRQPGTYNATVTVTDEDGSTSTDTLRVRVRKADGPSVSIAGPHEVYVGDSAGFSASVSAGSADLAAVTWRLDDRKLNRTNVDGESAVVHQAHAIPRTGTYTLEVTATDRLGRESTASRNVSVLDPANEDDDDGIDSTTGNFGDDSDDEACSRFGRDDDTYCNNDRMIADTDRITITDTDNDGTTEWAGQTFDEAFAEEHDGVSYDSTNGRVSFESQETYREVLDVDEFNVDPHADTNQDYVEEGSGDSGNSNNNDPFSNSGSDTDEGSDMRDHIIDINVLENPFPVIDGDTDGNNSGDEPNTRTGRVPPRGAFPVGFN